MHRSGNSMYVDGVGGCGGCGEYSLGVVGGRVIWELPVISAQISCEPITALKNCLLIFKTV